MTSYRRYSFAAWYDLASFRGESLLRRWLLSIARPGAGGTIFKLSKADGRVVSRINPFPTFDPTIIVAGVLSADSTGTNSEDGNLYAIHQDGTLEANIFLQLALDAA